MGDSVQFVLLDQNLKLGHQTNTGFCGSFLVAENMEKLVKNQGRIQRCQKTAGNCGYFWP